MTGAAVHRLSRAAPPHRRADAQPRHVRSGAQAALRGAATSSSGGACHGGGQVFGGGGIERERIKSCTAPDDPNYLSPTPTIPQNTTNYTGRLLRRLRARHPVAQELQARGHDAGGWGIDCQRRVPEQREPDQHARRMTVTRGITRYPANCPSPCPAGEIIMPTASSASRR